MKAGKFRYTVIARYGAHFAPFDLVEGYKGSALGAPAVSVKYGPDSKYWRGGVDLAEVVVGDRLPGWDALPQGKKIRRACELRPKPCKKCAANVSHHVDPHALTTWDSPANGPLAVVCPGKGFKPKMVGGNAWTPATVRW